MIESVKHSIGWTGIIEDRAAGGKACQFGVTLWLLAGHGLRYCPKRRRVCHLFLRRYP